MNRTRLKVSDAIAGLSLFQAEFVNHRYEGHSHPELALAVMELRDSNSNCSEATLAPFILLLRQMSAVVGLCRRAIRELWQQSVYALIWRKSAQLAEAFIESDDLLILSGNTKLFCVSHAQDYNSEDI